jgi:hypothetical protein
VNNYPYLTSHVENDGPGLGKAQKDGGVQPVSGIPTLSFMFFGVPMAIQI